MIIKIFKISTLEMYVFKNKNAFFSFVQNLDRTATHNMTIKQMENLLPKKEYYRVK